MEDLQWGPRAEPLWGLGQKPITKHVINFALRITLVNAYCPFYSSYVIITFVIGFSRSSHTGDLVISLHDLATSAFGLWFELIRIFLFTCISFSHPATMFQWTWVELSWVPKNRTVRFDRNVLESVCKVCQLLTICTLYAGIIHLVLVKVVQIVQ